MFSTWPNMAQEGVSSKMNSGLFRAAIGLAEGIADSSILN